MSTPEPVDLSHLRDRAQAYVVGLEAKLKTARTSLAEATARLSDPDLIDAATRERIQRAYRDGWKAACAATDSSISDAIRSMQAARSATTAAYERPDSPNAKEGQ